MKLSEKALELCWAIEDLPPSEQQTKISEMANDLRKNILSLPFIGIEPEVKRSDAEGAAMVDPSHHTD